LAGFYLGVFVLALALSFLLTRQVRRLAVAHGWLAVPTVDRHLHRMPIPRLGGIAIFLAFLLSVATALLVNARFHKLPDGLSAHRLLTILVPGLLIFLLGAFDDLRNLGPYVKFSVQTLAGVMLFLGGLRILDLPIMFGAHQFPWFVGLPLTVLWVLAITNAFNLIDGLDGLAAGSALFSTLVVFVVALVSQSSLVALMTIALAGAILGFLRFNFNPATIFLGDCGSLFIGFLLSALALEGAQKAPTIVAVAIPVVSFGLPILETALSVLRRLISGRPVFTADREHIHHKLLQRGLSHRQVVIVLYAVSALFGLVSLFLLWPTGSSLGLVLAVVGTGVWLGVQHLGYLEFGELRRVALRTMEQRQIFVNNLAIRRATEELKRIRDYPQLCRVLVAAFEANDFDAFRLTVRLFPDEESVINFVRPSQRQQENIDFDWKKTGTITLNDSSAAWSLTLDLVTTSNRRWGLLTIHRLYTQRDLQLDVNLLTSIFPVALADALDRVLAQEAESITEQGAAVMVAEAG
jgi:UDP-GlcNAc:undecaprenyl-phosphate/decaprenyl-phosphate GlcNAc-1-phosphate transferase